MPVRTAETLTGGAIFLPAAAEFAALAVGGTPCRIGDGPVPVRTAETLTGGIRRGRSALSLPRDGRRRPLPPAAGASAP